MAVDGVSNNVNTSALNYQRSNAVADVQELTMTDFYKLMAAEMQYQNPDDPMDTSDLMAQMVQTKMITAMAQMTSTSMITYATSMLGKEVTVAEVDSLGRGTGEYTKGTITGVSLAGETPTVFIGDKEYKMSQIMSVGTVRTQEEIDNDNKNEDGETSGDDNKTDAEESV